MIRRMAWALLDSLGARSWRLKNGPARGLEIYAPARRGVGFRSGRYEPWVAARLAQQAQLGATVVDAGAHLGFHTLALASCVGPSGRVFAFEPAPTAGALLDRTLRRNHLPQVERLALALSDRQGTATLRQTANAAMNHLVPANPSSTEPQDTTQVQTTTLDHWASERALQRLDLLKIDVEGGELALLRGGRQTLEQFRPTLVCELHSHPSLPARPSQVVAELRGQNYEVDRLGPGLELDEAVALAESESHPGEMTILHVEAVPMAR